MIRVSVVLILCALMAACATPRPALVGPALNQVLAHPDAHSGQRVRWGGRIAHVDNQPHDTLIEIVQQPLLGNGRPETTSSSAGRFLARFNRFMDPAIFAPGNRLTVTGTLNGVRSGRIGQYPYKFPLVDVIEYRLWPKQEPPRIIYYHDPWWPGAYIGAYPWPYPYR